MDLAIKLSSEEVKELFSKNWLTHDAMWYGICVKELGPEKANQLNKQAVRLMAAIEIRRIVGLMGRPMGAGITTFRELNEIIGTAFELVQTSFMPFDYSFPEENMLLGSFNECFAYNGVKKYGMIANYDCGIVERVKGWLDGLSVAYVMEPDFTGCLMHQKGTCEVLFRFNLA